MEIPRRVSKARSKCWRRVTRGTRKASGRGRGRTSFLGPENPNNVCPRHDRKSSCGAKLPTGNCQEALASPTGKQGRDSFARGNIASGEAGSEIASPEAELASGEARQGSFARS